MTNQTYGQPATRNQVGPVTHAPKISFAEGVRLVATRELLNTVRSKAFIWSLISTLVLIALVVLGQNFLGQVMSSVFGGDDEVKVASTLPFADEPGIKDEIEKAGLHMETIGSVEAGVKALEAGEIDALVVSSPEAQGLDLYTESGDAVSSESPSGLTVIGDKSAQQQVVSAFTVVPTSAVLHPDSSGFGDPGARMWTGFGFGLLFFTVLVMSTQRLSQSIVEEKSSRIVELLVSTVTPNTILAGKIIAGTIVALGQLLLIGATLFVCLTIAGNADFAVQLLPAVVWFLIFTVFGFLLYAALYAAISATLSRPEDVASGTAPLVYILMVPYMGVFLGAMNDTIMAVLSYLPISSPVAMPSRILFGGVEWWEPILSLVILIVSAALLIWLAGRIYRNSILRTGGRVKLRDALQG